MTDERRFDRELIDILDGMAPTKGPDSLLDGVVEATATTRPRSRWLADVRQRPLRLEGRTDVGSPTARLVAVMAATVLLAALTIGAAVAGTRWLGDAPIVVDGSGTGDHATISDALAAANDGDTIVVRPGTYDESLLITRDVRLRGDPTAGPVVVRLPLTSRLTTFRGQGIEDVSRPLGIRIVGSDATVEGLTIAAPDPGVAVLIEGGRPSLSDIDVTFDGPGLPRDGSEATSSRVAIVVTDGSTARIADSRLSGYVAVRDGASPELVGNELTEATLSIDGPGETRVLANRFGEGAQVVARERAVSLIEDNDFIGAGARINRGAEVVFRDNVVADVDGSAITVAHSDTSVVIDGTRISDSTIGLVISGDATVELRGSVICGNEVDLDLVGAREPVIVGSEVCRR